MNTLTEIQRVKTLSHATLATTDTNNQAALARTTETRLHNTSEYTVSVRHVCHPGRKLLDDSGQSRETAVDALHFRYTGIVCRLFRGGHVGHIAMRALPTLTASQIYEAQEALPHLNTTLALYFGPDEKTEDCVTATGVLIEVRRSHTPPAFCLLEYRQHVLSTTERDCCRLKHFP